MAAYPTWTLDDLVGFSGRPAESYNDNFGPTAIVQAKILFRTLSGLAEWPDDPDDAELATIGVMSMADHFWLSRKYAPIEASGLNSESLGSYHYQKMYGSGRGMRGQTASGSQGQPFRATGVAWFDMAVERLGVSDFDTVVSGSIGVFERDLALVLDADGDKQWVVTDAELSWLSDPTGSVISSNRALPTRQV